MSNLSVTVNLGQLIDEVPSCDPIQVGKISRDDVHCVLNKIFNMTPTSDTCFTCLHCQHEDNVIRIHGTKTRLTELTIYQEFNSRRCTLCGGDKTPTACAHNIRLGKCKDAFMTQVAALMYPKQYQK